MESEEKLIWATRGLNFTSARLSVVHADRGDGRAMMLWRARAAGVPEARRLEQIERFEPADCFGGGLVGHTKPYGDDANTQSKLTKVQRFSREPLVGRQLGGVGAEVSTSATSNGEQAAVRFFASGSTILRGLAASPSVAVQAGTIARPVSCSTPTGSSEDRGAGWA